MKELLTKIVFCFAAAACVCAVLPREAKAADVSVGGTVWVSQWEPFFKKAYEAPESYSYIDESMKNCTVNSSAKMTTDLGLVAGPVFSVRFTDTVSWSNALNLGQYKSTLKTTSVTTYDDGTPSKTSIDKTSITTFRGDLDSMVNYALNSYLKVFGGAKLMYVGYSYSMVGTDYSFSNKGVGPGAGVSLTLPVTENLFAIGNFSGLYLRSMIAEDQMKHRDYYNILGGNTTLSLAYYFPSLNLTASAGGRYQILRYYSEKSGDEVNKSFDKFYGLIFSLIYSF